MAERFRLGCVPATYSGEYERYRGWLSIPYLSPSGPVAIRFRRIEGEGKKYLQPDGSRSWLYNTQALLRESRTVVIAEGEFDAMVCDHFTPFPAVAIAGTNAWRPEFRRCFEGCDVVLIAADGDDAGAGMVERLCKELPQARDAQLPPGKDVNTFYLENGAQALTDYLRGKL